MTPSSATRSAELGIELPAVVAPLAAYVPAVRTGNLVYTSGQLPMVGGELPQAGKVGAEVSRRGGQGAGPASARSTRWPPCTPWSASTRWSAWSRSSDSSRPRPASTASPASINGASELFGEVFGDAGAHARSAVGVSELPLNAPVEVELIVEVA